MSRYKQDNLISYHIILHDNANNSNKNIPSIKLISNKEYFYPISH